MPRDVWESGASYESYVGRWSRLVAGEFLSWIEPPSNAWWLDIGCGTGAISNAVVATRDPARVLGFDSSPGFVNAARLTTRDTRASFQVCDAQALCVKPATFDVAVSGLVLNFVPDPAKMLAEAAAALRPGGLLGVYVWDYGGRMEMIRYFWEAARAVDSAMAGLDEAQRFPMCRPGPLRALLSAAGLAEVAAVAIDIATTFADFDAYWSPFLGGQGAGPAYAATLSQAHRAELREHLQRTLPFEPDGSIRLVARAWAAKGRRQR
jgi:trans-aconitate methyltransferase